MDELKLRDRALRLQVQIAAKDQADGLESLAHAATDLKALLNEALTTLQQSEDLGNYLSVDGAPRFNRKEFNAALGAFRRGRSREPLRVLQQESADSLKRAAKAYERAAQAWARTAWREQVRSRTRNAVEAASSLEQAGNIPMTVARLRHQLEMLADLNPLTDVNSISQSLGVERSNWLEAIDNRAQTLINEVRKQQQASATLPAAVRLVLRLATSESGFPLTDLTPEVLEQLLASEHGDRLVVRRRP